MIPTNPSAKSRSKTNGATNGHATSNGHASSTERTSRVGMASVIQEAEALHESLSKARSHAHRLVMALRRQRKHDRLVATTLASLRELKLQEVGG